MTEIFWLGQNVPQVKWWRKSYGILIWSFLCIPVNLAIFGKMRFCRFLPLLNFFDPFFLHHSTRGPYRCRAATLTVILVYNVWGLLKNKIWKFVWRIEKKNNTKVQIYVFWLFMHVVISKSLDRHTNRLLPLFGTFLA